MILTGIPLWLAGIIMGIALAVLAGAHFLHQKYTRTTVPTLLFWSSILKRHQQNSLLGRFQHILTFIFLSAIVLLIVSALLRPVVQLSGKYQHNTVIILDQRMSMGLTNQGTSQTRLKQAQDLCADFLTHRLTPAGVMLIAVGNTARVITNLTDPVTDACLYLKHLSVSSCASSDSMDQALTMAETIAAQDKNTDVIVFTDHQCCLSHYSRALQLCTAIVNTGEPVKNLALLNPVVTQESDTWQRLTVPLAFWGKGVCSGVLELHHKLNGIEQKQDFTVGADTIESVSFKVKTEDLPLLSIHAVCQDKLNTDNQCKPGQLPGIRVYIARHIPEPLRVGVESISRFQCVDSADQADLIIDQANDSYARDRARVILVNQGESLISASEIKVCNQLFSDHSTARTLAADLFTGSGPVLTNITDQAVSLLVTQADEPLAVLDKDQQSNVVYLSQALFHSQASFWKQAQFPVILNALIERALKDHVQTEPIALATGADLAYADLYHVPENNTDIMKPVYRISLYQVLVFGILLMCLLEIFSFYKGKIV